MIAVGRVATGGGLGVVRRWRASPQAWRSRPRKPRSSCCRPRSSPARSPGGRWEPGRPPHALADGRWRRAALVSLAAAAAVAALFYSSFLAAPGGVLEPFRGGRHLPRSRRRPGGHAHPWHYYLGLLAYSSSGGLTWSEGLVLVLAIVGAVDGVGPAQSLAPDASSGRAISPATSSSPRRSSRPSATRPPGTCCPSTSARSCSPGSGSRRSSTSPRPASCAARWRQCSSIGAGQLGWQAWRASVTYASDPRNPYVYAQTVPDAVRMATRIRELAAAAPRRGAHAGVGHRPAVRAVAAALVSPGDAARRLLGRAGRCGWPCRRRSSSPRSSTRAALDASLGDRYVSEFYGLRPEVLLALYVERGLWDRFLAEQRSR